MIVPPQRAGLRASITDARQPPPVVVAAAGFQHRATRSGAFDCGDALAVSIVGTGPTTAAVCQRDAGGQSSGGLIGVAHIDDGDGVLARAANTEYPLRAPALSIAEFGDL